MFDWVLNTSLDLSEMTETCSKYPRFIEQKQSLGVVLNRTRSKFIGKHSQWSPFCMQALLEMGIHCELIETFSGKNCPDAKAFSDNMFTNLIMIYDSHQVDTRSTLNESKIFTWRLGRDMNVLYMFSLGRMFIDLC